MAYANEEVTLLSPLPPRFCLCLLNFFLSSKFFFFLLLNGCSDITPLFSSKKLKENHQPNKTLFECFKWVPNAVVGFGWCFLKGEENVCIRHDKDKTKQKTQNFVIFRVGVFLLLWTRPPPWARSKSSRRCVVLSLLSNPLIKITPLKKYVWVLSKL